MNYGEILEKLKESPVPLESVQCDIVPSGLKMVNHFHPWSISETEFNFITNKIIERNLKDGFEIATAFGISALAAGLGFKETGGYLVTMDAYIEEHYNYCGGYRESRNETYKDMDGFKSVNHICKTFDLVNTVYPVVGWSPDDIGKFLVGLKLDYAFIDGGHWNEQVIRDARGIKEYLSEDKFTVFFHDGHSITDGVRQELSEIIGGEFKTVLSMPHSWNLGVIER